MSWQIFRWAKPRCTDASCLNDCHALGYTSEGGMQRRTQSHVQKTPGMIGCRASGTHSVGLSFDSSDVATTRHGLYHFRPQPLADCSSVSRKEHRVARLPARAHTARAIPLRAAAARYTVIRSKPLSTVCDRIPLVPPRARGRIYPIGRSSYSVFLLCSHILSRFRKLLRCLSPYLQAR